MFRRNFLALLGLSPATLLWKPKTPENSVINIPTDAVYRQESSDDFGTVITYKKDGELYREDGPAQIKFNWDGGLAEYHWHEGRGINNPYAIEILRNPVTEACFCTAHFSKDNYICCNKYIQWSSVSKKTVYSCNERGYKELQNRNQQWFEQKIGMTLEQLHSFR